MQIPFYGWFYRAFMRLAHRFEWHHATISGPFEDGKSQRWCRWCGLRESYRYDPRKPPTGPVSSLTEIWHKSHNVINVCYACQKPIGDAVYGIGQNGPIHWDCYDKLFPSPNKGSETEVGRPERL